MAEHAELSGLAVPGTASHQPSNSNQVFMWVLVNQFKASNGNIA